MPLYNFILLFGLWRFNRRSECHCCQAVGLKKFSSRSLAQLSLSISEPPAGAPAIRCAANLCTMGCQYLHSACNSQRAVFWVWQYSGSSSSGRKIPLPWDSLSSNRSVFGEVCISILVDAKMLMFKFGKTWRARVQRLLMKARAHCWETCFLHLVSMTSRHWRTISTPHW